MNEIEVNQIFIWLEKEEKILLQELSSKVSILSLTLPLREPKIREMIIELLGSDLEQEEVQEDLSQNRISCWLVLKRLFFDLEKTELIPEKWLAAQYSWIKEKERYFLSLRNKPWDHNGSNDWQIEEKVSAINNLEFLGKLKEKVSLRLKTSPLWQNQLEYLLG